ncbi:MAG: heat-shock protein, partial [Massilia sp.]|nr:heat-shock protein [Massilia sp.]
EIGRAGFNDAIAHLLASIDSTVVRMLADAQVAPQQVDTVFFTGGSSGVLALRERIGRLLPAANKVEGDLFGSIGSGLAIDAVRKFGPAA